MEQKAKSASGVSGPALRPEKSYFDIKQEAQEPLRSDWTEDKVYKNVLKSFK